MTEPADNPPIHPEPDEPARTGFANMPGGGKVAVVILWIQFGLSACLAALVVLAISLLFDGSTSIEWDLVLTEAPWVPPVLILLVAAFLAQVVLRAVFATKIPQRSARARFWCVTLEVVGIALGLILWAVPASLGASTTDGTGMESNPAGNCLGLILSIVLISLLSTSDMREWCDR